MALVIILAGWFLLLIRGTLVIFFVAYVLMAGLSPLVGYLHKKGIPRLLAVFLPYLAALALVVVFAFALAPKFLSEFQDLFQNIPDVLDKVSSFFGIQANSSRGLSDLFSLLHINPSNIIGLTSAIGQAVLTAIAVLAISIYMLLGRNYLHNIIAGLFPVSSRQKARDAIDRVDLSLGGWLRGQMILSAIIGVAVWIFLSLAGVEFSAVLGLLGGLLEIIPYAGPVLAAAPAIIIALNVSLAKAAVVAVGYIAIQQLENHLLVPNVMKRSVGLHPLAVIAVVIAGAELAGILGALIAVPLATFIKSIYLSFNQPGGPR